MVGEGDVTHRENEVIVQSFISDKTNNPFVLTLRQVPCVEVLNPFVPIYHSPNLDKALLDHEIEDAEQIHHGEDGEEEEEG